MLKYENERHLKEKHVICQQKINDLIIDNKCLKDRIEGLEPENRKLSNDVIIFQKEIEKHEIDKKNFNFKEFVALKRELNMLKEERERQFANLVVNQSNQNLTMQQTHLPPIKPLKKNLFNFFNQNA